MESAIADAYAIATEKSARTYRRPTGREERNGGVVVRHGSPRLDGVRGWVRSRLSERKHHTTESLTRRILGVLPANMGNSDERTQGF